MKILLINHNPVVSRLTSLSAKKENVELDEIKEISELVENDYNIVFVDSESYDDSIANILKNLGAKRKVLFYTQGDENHKTLFDDTILKPFLPSEVSAILREAKIEAHKKEETQVEEETLNELDTEAPIEERESKVESPTLNESKPSKEEKEKKEDDFDTKLKEAFPLQLDDLDEPKKEDKKPSETTSPKEDEKIELDAELFELDEKETKSEAEESNLFEVDKEIKEKVITDDLLDLDFESKDEVDFEIDLNEKPQEEKREIPKESEEKKEEEKIETKEETKTPEIQEEKIEAPQSTKVLDQEEVSSIKNLLADEKNLTDDNITLDDIVTPTAPPLIDSKKPENEKKRRKKEKKEKEPASSSTPQEPLNTAEVLASTLGRLPTEDLRKLLRGATVNITIQFPNEL